MAAARDNHCGCFPTGRPYPGIAELLLRSPLTTLGVAEEIAAGHPIIDLPFALIDTETTGRDPARGDRVIEIAIVYFDGGVPTERFTWLFDPGMPIPPESSAVHGISDADVRGQPKFDAIAREILAKLMGRIPVAYNAGFDRAFIFAEMRRAGITPGNDRALPPALRSNVEWIDPLVWARVLQPAAKGFKLGEVSARLDVKLEGAHRATNDAEAAGHVMFALLRGIGMSYRDTVQKQREHANALERARAMRKGT